MKEIVKEKEKYIDLASPIEEKISPYNSAYPALLLSNSLRARLQQAQISVEEVYKAVAKNAPIFTQVRQFLKKGYRYVVDASESTLKAIDSGKIKLSTDNTGSVFAQIRKANGQYSSNIPIIKEFFSIDPVQMTNALQMAALQDQLQEIADQINIIDIKVREVLQGQQNDRIGLYYSGLALYLESRNIIDSEIKKHLIVQSLRTLSEATFQLKLTMQTDIQYLVNKGYESAKGRSVELIDAHIYNINQAFAFIHQATILRAGIYCDQKELPAMSTVFDEYSRFLDDNVTKHADLLAQYDTADDGTEEGVWKSRTRLKLDVSDFAKQLNNPNKIIYLGISKENE